MVGHQPTGVSSHIANLWTTYAFSIGGVPGFQIGGGLSYRGKIYGNVRSINSERGQASPAHAFAHDAPRGLKPTYGSYRHRSERGTELWLSVPCS